MEKSARLRHQDTAVDTRVSAILSSNCAAWLKRSSAYWRVTIDNPPINVMGPVMVKQFQEVINALEADEQVRVVVFDSGLQNRSWRACFESLRRCFTNSET